MLSCKLEIAALRFLAARTENYKAPSGVDAEVNAITRCDKNAQFVTAFVEGRDIIVAAELKATEFCTNQGSRLWVSKSVEPFHEWTSTACSLEDEQFPRHYVNVALRFGPIKQKPRSEDKVILRKQGGKAQRRDGRGQNRLRTLRKDREPPSMALYYTLDKVD